jgi:hypothetical protein
MENVIIGDKSLNSTMNTGAEIPAINRIYGNDEVLWYEATVDSYYPGLDYFANSITVRYGAYDPATATRGPALGGDRFDRVREPPFCPASGAHASIPVAPVEAAPQFEREANRDFRFESTFQICREELATRTFHVSSGGIEVELDPRWTTPSGDPAGLCPQTALTVVLEQEGSLWGWNEVSRADVQVGRTSALRWRYLDDATYRFRFVSSNPDDRECCLSGHVYVGTFQSTRDRVQMPTIA